MMYLKMNRRVSIFAALALLIAVVGMGLWATKAHANPQNIHVVAWETTNDPEGPMPNENTVNWPQHNPHLDYLPVCLDEATWVQIDRYQIDDEDEYADFMDLINSGVLNGSWEDSKFGAPGKFWSFKLIPACEEETATPTPTPTETTPEPEPTPTESVTEPEPQPTPSDSPSEEVVVVPVIDDTPGNADASAVVEEETQEATSSPAPVAVNNVQAGGVPGEDVLASTGAGNALKVVFLALVLIIGGTVLTARARGSHS